MGQTLSEPVTSKETAICQNDFYKVRKKSAEKQIFQLLRRLLFWLNECFLCWLVMFLLKSLCSSMFRSAAVVCRDGE